MNVSVDNHMKEKRDFLIQTTLLDVLLMRTGTAFAPALLFNHGAFCDSASGGAARMP